MSDPTTHIALTVPAIPASVGSIRSLVARSIAAIAPAELVDDAVLVVSELATNAIEHADTPTVDVDVGLTQWGLRLAVAGASRGSPVVRDQVPIDDNRGRGLLIVSKLSSRWGGSRHGGRNVVWAEFDLVPDDHDADAGQEDSPGFDRRSSG